MLTPQDILQKYWQHASFRPLQKEIIEHVLLGKDTLAILPTGGGKSICYQIPGLLLPGCCIVVSPLIALMVDQVQGLQQKGIKACMVSSVMHQEEVQQIFADITKGMYSFLFVSPERLKTNLFLDYVEDWQINLLVVDEAHCISQWGYDFRPSYLQIATVRKYLPDIPVLALTASATKIVQQDIQEKLGFISHQLFFSTFYRPSISISSMVVESKINTCIHILQKMKGSCLVYCASRKRCKQVADSLLAEGIIADYYHAGLDTHTRNKKQQQWIDNSTQCMVCTNAFGMGIDKGDVQCVIHFDLPESLESYYQEIGRAGRNGSKSYTILLYQQADKHKLIHSIALKYPSIERLKTIYENICWYLNIAYGDGAETVYDFEITDFANRYHESTIEVLYAIKLLEQQGFWLFSESVYTPSTLSVIASKEELFQLEKNAPALDEVLKQILRLYGGLWQHFVPIREFDIAQHIGVGKDYVIHILHQLKALQIIDYKPAKEKPQLVWLLNRVPLSLWMINKQQIQSLKTRYTERVEAMLAFAENTELCRMKQLVAYFGESKARACGICDNCLKKKTMHLTFEQYTSLTNTILHEISLATDCTIEKLVKQFSSVQQENVQKIIRFLMEENKIAITNNHVLILKK